jgi:hypothetical protein
VTSGRLGRCVALTNRYAMDYPFTPSIARERLQRWRERAERQIRESLDPTRHFPKRR